MSARLSNRDQLSIIKRCIQRAPFAWEDFVDTFMEPILFVVDQTALRRNFPLNDNQRGQMCEAVFRSFRHNDFQLLKEFEGRASATTYLMILARRLVVGFLDVR